MRRSIGIILILTLVVGATIAGYLLLTPEPYDIAEDPDVEVLQIERDTILTTVNAVGRIEPVREAEVNFEIGGVVDEILVQEGEIVEVGNILARLRTDELSLAVEAAQADLARAQAQLQQVLDGAIEEDVASARAELKSAELQLAKLYEPADAADVETARLAVESAEATLNEVMAGKDENEVTVAAASLRKAEIALKEAQWAYDQVAYWGEVGSLPQAAQLEQATIDYETAKANYLIVVKDPGSAEVSAAQAQVAEAESALSRLLEGPDEAEVAAAQARVAQASAALVKLETGARESEIASARAAMEAAEVGLKQATLNYDRAELRSPMAGTISQVNVKVGESALARTGDALTAAAFVVADLSTYMIKVEIDELDIGRVAPDQRAAISIDAITDVDFEGHLSEIAPAPLESTSGIVAYEVTISLDTYDPRLLPGMTADATIETESLEDVLVIPNRAVSIDRDSGAPVTYVERLDEEGQPVRAEIELGLRNETVSEVVSGLEEGDRVVILQQSRREQLQRVFQGGE
jgi:HlyD family secretion protein